jgi:hypothetical protein
MAGSHLAWQCSYCAPSDNIIAILLRRDRSKPALALMAYYDSGIRPESRTIPLSPYS